MPEENFGAWIKRARERAGFTQAEVAEEIGHTVDSVSKVERNINGTTMNTLLKLAALYGCEVGDLLPHDGYSDAILLELEPLARAIERYPKDKRAAMVRVWTALANELGPTS